MKNLLLIVFLFIFSFSAFSQTDKPEKDTQNQGSGSGIGSGSGTGNGAGDGTGSGKSDRNRTDDKTSVSIKKQPEKNARLKIISKPIQSYTDLARQNNVQGKVILDVRFLKNGKIGKIKVIQGLPDGLTEQAVEAANKIRFEPERKNGKPVTVKKRVEYTFTIY